jgi:hypothetical protein
MDGQTDLANVGVAGSNPVVRSRKVIRNHHVTVAERDGAVEGVVVLRVTDEGFLIDNVAVHPSHGGRVNGGIAGARGNFLVRRSAESCSERVGSLWGRFCRPQS